MIHIAVTDNTETSAAAAVVVVVVVARLPAVVVENTKQHITFFLVGYTYSDVERQAVHVFFFPFPPVDSFPSVFNTLLWGEPLN